MQGFLEALGISTLVNAGCFALAASRRTDKVTDFAYALSFVLATATLVLRHGATTPLRLAMAAMVILWAVRLGAFLVRRILRMQVDHRFDGIRERPAAFAQFWLLQAVAVPVILLPAIQVLTGPEPPPGPLHALGLAAWAAGLAIESLADAQKSAWKRRGAEGPLTTGLWAWSRHPNHFGEALLWWGLWLFALPSLSGWGHSAVLGPLLITLLLLFVTGIPPLEASAEAKYGHLPSFRDYRARTSRFLLRPPRRTPAGSAAPHRQSRRTP